MHEKIKIKIKHGKMMQKNTNSRSAPKPALNTAAPLQEEIRHNIRQR